MGEKLRRVNSADPDDTNDAQPDLKKLVDPKRVLQILDCRRKILIFVESMLEPDICIEELDAGLELICRSDYDNIVQERHILKICGYPLCSKKLTREWKQRYHLSLKDHKIYDVEVRKLYCSVHCMNTSIKYRDERLHAIPVWMRLENLRLGPCNIQMKDNDATL